MPFISIRLWQPVSAVETEVFSWFAVDRYAPDWYKQASLQGVPDVLRLLRDVRAGRRRELDVDHADGARPDGRRLNLHSRMGLDRDGRLLPDAVEAWPAPGAPTSDSASTTSATLLNLWADLSRSRSGGTSAGGHARRWPADAHAAARERRCTRRHTTFLVREAALLDERRHREWLDLLTDDIVYRMPVRVTAPHDARGQPARGHGPLRRGPLLPCKRVSASRPSHAWTEDPPSRTRRFVTNVRAFDGDGPTRSW